MNKKQFSTIDNQPSHYVVIGASAGGLEAIDAFFNQMPERSGCAFIVVQHLSPDYKSLMAELLSKRTPMPVNRAEEGVLAEADQVYLIPPNHDLRIFHGKLMLTEQDRHGGLNLPIDIFLTSLAEDQGEKAIAIIMSGTGSDGTRGIKSIKEKLGMVIVQDEETAGFDGMPRSAIATGLVDYILAPEDMPEQLISYLKHPYVTKQDHSLNLLSEEDDTNKIFSILREKTSLDFTYYKPSTMVRRIERRMSINQILTLSDYLRYIQRYPTEVDALYKDLLIGVTNFFRDPETFLYLYKNFLPDLIKKFENKTMRIWVTACSTGEEAYTLAILCQEIISELKIKTEVKIFATDVDKHAIAAAGQGRYPESISVDIEPTLLSRYFQKSDDGYIISRQIREMVVFAQHNVIRDPPFTNIALVSCRNMLIYLQNVLQQRVMELFNFSLIQDGILFLGSSETTGDMSDYYESLHNKHKIFRSKGKKKKEKLSEQAITYEPSSKFSNASFKSSTLGYRGTHEDERIAERLLQGSADNFFPFAMVINEQMELVHTVGESGKYLKFPTGKMVNNVVKLLQKDLSIPISTGIQKVLQNSKAIDYSNIHLRDNKTSTSSVNMHISLLPQTRAQQRLIAVFIIEKSPSLDSEEANQNYDVGQAASQRINDLEQELQFSRENLQATVEELETSNEELQATNEELLASNEELQSTNEELQSVNEELYTVNAEHQSKITELTDANNDLDNLLLNIGIPTLFLDNNLEIRRFTPEVTQIIRIIEQDIGRPFNHLTHNLHDIDLFELIQKVNQNHIHIEEEVEDLDGNVYLLRIFPYRVGPTFFSGVLLTFVNLNTTKSIQKELILSQESNNLAQEIAKLGNWDWDIENNTLKWSDAIEKIFGLGKGEFTKTYDEFVKLIHPDDRKLVADEVRECLDDPSKEYKVQHRIIWPDGSIRWMLEQGKVHVGSDGKAIRMLGMVKDITEEHASEEALKQSEFLFRSTLDNLNMIAIQLDSKGNIVFANDYLIEMTKVPSDEIVGMNWFDNFIEEKQKSKVKEVFDSFITDNKKINTHYNNQIITRDGQKIDIAWSNTPIYNKDNQPVGISSIGYPLVNG